MRFFVPDGFLPFAFSFAANEPIVVVALQTLGHFVVILHLPKTGIVIQKLYSIPGVGKYCMRGLILHSHPHTHIIPHTTHTHLYALCTMCINAVSAASLSLCSE